MGDKSAAIRALAATKPPPQPDEREEIGLFLQVQSYLGPPPEPLTPAERFAKENRFPDEFKRLMEGRSPAIKPLLSPTRSTAEVLREVVPLAVPIGKEVFVRVEEKRSGLQRWLSPLDPVLDVTGDPFNEALIATGFNAANLAYPLEYQFGGVASFFDLRQFPFPLATRFGSFGSNVTFSGTIADVVMEKRRPIEDFAQLRAVCHAAYGRQMGRDSLEGRLLDFRQDETHPYVTQGVGVDLDGFFVGVSTGHLMGFPDIGDYRKDQLINAPFPKMTQFYSRKGAEMMVPEFRFPPEAARAFSFRLGFGEVIGVGAEVGFKKSFLGEDGRPVFNPQTGDYDYGRWEPNLRLRDSF